MSLINDAQIIEHILPSTGPPVGESVAVAGIFERGDGFLTKPLSAAIRAISAGCATPPRAAHAQPDRRVSIDAVGRRPSRIRLWTLMSSVGRTRHFASIVAFSASTIRWKLQPGFPSK